MHKSLYFLSLVGTLLIFFISSCGDSNVKPLDTAVFKKLKFHFKDTDPAKNVIQGTLFLEGANTLSAVKSYVIYWGNRPASAGKGQKLKEVQPPVKNILLSLDTGTPIKEDYLLLYFKQADGKEVYSEKALKVNDLFIQKEKKEVTPKPQPTPPELEDKTEEEKAPAPPQEKAVPDVLPVTTTAPIAVPEAPTNPLPEPTQVEAAPSKAAAPAVMVIFIKNILFEFDRSSLSQEYMDHLLEKLADLEDKENVKLRIEGHADERGSNEYNLALGEKRAYAVEKFLITLGFSEENIEVVSFGEEKPVAKGHSESSWSKNRRAVTEVKTDEK